MGTNVQDPWAPVLTPATSEGSPSTTTAVAVANSTVPDVRFQKASNESLTIHGQELPAGDLLAIDASDLAKQITLLDLAAYKAIKPMELHGGAWMKKDKFAKAPNVVNMTRRFNHTSFWVTREVLHATSSSNRADKLSHFVKIAKKLLEFNNIHGVLAVLSGLHSAPVYRLSRTWKLLSSKTSDRFGKLEDLLSQDDNCKAVRDLHSNLKQPCVPYLALFLNDITHRDSHNKRLSRIEGQGEPEISVDTHIHTLLSYQDSEYKFEVVGFIREYITAMKYSEELQKMIEDENFRLSLQIEPRDGDAVSSSNESEGPTQTIASKLAHLVIQPMGSLPFRVRTPQKKRGHRKALSLGNASSFFGSSNNRAEEKEARQELTEFMPEDLDDEVSECNDSLDSGDSDIEEGESFFFPQDDIAFSQFEEATKQGALRRRTTRAGLKSYKKQYAVLSGTTLHLFSAKGKQHPPPVNSVPSASIPLIGATVKSLCQCKRPSFSVKLLNGRTLRFNAETAKLRDEWAKVLEASSMPTTLTLENG